MSLRLYELKGRDDRRYSLFSWRARLALAHKGVGAEFVPVLLKDKERIAFSGGRTVPILQDGDIVVRDSWRIACHLEDKYPDRPSLFGGSVGRGVTRTFADWVDRALVPRIISLLAVDAVNKVHPDDRDYFRVSMEKAFNGSLEEIASRRDREIDRFRELLSPLRRTLRDQPFIAGAEPAYADFVLFSLFRWCAIMSDFPALAADDTVLNVWRSKLATFADSEASAA
jgi:glutathione S-transferase